MSNKIEEQYQVLTLKLEIEPSLSHPLCITVNREEITYKGDLEITPFRYGGKINSETIPISPLFFINLIDNLNLTQITAIPKCNFMGEDGTNYILTINNGLYSAKYRWWEECPPEWKILGNFAENLIDYVKSHNKLIINQNDKIEQS